MVHVFSTKDGVGAVTKMEQDLYHRQFEEGPVVYVKNTFLDHIDCDKVPCEVPVTRGCSAPASVTCVAVAISKSAPLSEEHATSIPRLQLGMDQESSATLVSELPPTPHAMIRSSTYDPFENSEEWLPAGSEWGHMAECTLESGGAMMMPAMLAGTLSESTNTGMMPPMIAGAYLPGKDSLPAFAASAGEWLPVAFPACSAALTASSGHVGTPPIVATNRLLHADAFNDTDRMDSTWDISMTGPPCAELESTASQTASQTLVRTACRRTGVHRVYWTLDAKRLNGSCRTAVSPAFEIMKGGPPSFKMMLTPKATNHGRGGGSFKKSKGKGVIQLKCEADMQCFPSSPITFTIAVGKSREDVKNEMRRGPVVHDFVVQNGLCSLPKDQDTWDFNQFVDEASQTLVICLEIL